MSETEARAVVEAARDLGIAFVEDDYQVTADGEVYNPLVDRMGAEAWLLDQLMNK